MGVMGQRGDLKSPFGHIDASIWKEGDLPERMIEASYEYCEEPHEDRGGEFLSLLQVPPK